MVASVAARFVGSVVHRKEDRRLLTGHGRYVGDVQMRRMVHGAFLRSELASARLVGVDVSAARELPGVVGVLVWSDFPEVGEAWHAMLGEVSLPRLDGRVGCRDHAALAAS